MIHTLFCIGSSPEAVVAQGVDIDAGGSYSCFSERDFPLRPPLGFRNPTHTQREKHRRMRRRLSLNEFECPNSSERKIGEGVDKAESDL